MKKLILPLLLACAFFLCTGCMQSYDPVGADILAEVAGEDVHILFDEGVADSGTVESAHGDYRFVYSENGDLSITYPNGYVYSRTEAAADWPYPESPKDLGYFPADALCDSLDLASGADTAETPQEEPASRVPPVVSIALIALGLWLLLSPMGAWKLIVESFRPEAEPQTRTLRIYRVVGAVLTVTGCFLFFL